MTLAPWREGSFEIATQDGQFIVNGFVSEEFGIRDAGPGIRHGRSRIWQAESLLRPAPRASPNLKWQWPSPAA